VSGEVMVDIAKLSTELDRLAKFSDAPAPGVTRVMLSDTDLAARKWLMDLFTGAGLIVRVDAAGNIFARWIGSDAKLSAVATGSHTDAIPHAGMYDGTVGVLGGLEAIRSLQRVGFRLKRSIELIMFTSEEPTRYGVGCLGSRLMSGVMSADKAAKLKDSDGVAFGDFYHRAGAEGGLSDVRLERGHYHAFAELHIEQGPLLEKAGLPIGVVTAIAAPAALRVTYEGSGGHAGAVLMADRRDALLPAAKLALVIDEAARTLGGRDTVATTGVLDVHPRAINSIPSKTYLEIDVRDIDAARRDKVLERIRVRAKELGDEHHQTTTIEMINADPPATCDPNIVAAIEAACNEAELKSQRMISRAYHDSLFMAQICPTAMIFIPCRNGYSHRPDEYASPEAIEAGVRVLAGTLKRLASE
jgi:hydantoinase/carbamoylase family amidase